MTYDVQAVESYETTVDGGAAEAAGLLSLFAAAGVSLLAYRAIPIGPRRTRFILVPNDGSKMAHAATEAELHMNGPRPALYVRGGDESGALAEIYARLSGAGIGLGESAGLADIHGAYGVILYLDRDACERATAALDA